ncbi:MAG: hypothetical protein E7523_04070 [Ruminococcaceae bacterium]|nr:hypothetical protein [Oscillospiraceae bacterium]
MVSDQNLLNTVLSKSRLREKENLAQKVYRDEPILMTASQMANFTPPIYRKMREIARTAYNEPENVIFYKQARFMEHHEDNYEHHVEFLRYYPTYVSMSDAQLRCYFTWRTKVRKGEIQKTSLSFAYIYIYELLNGIGVDSTEEGFLQLLHFLQEYSALDCHIGTYMNRWLKDYCIYYNLNATFLKKIPDFKDKTIAHVLIDAKNQSDCSVFDALVEISAYNIKSSRFFKQYKDVCISVSAEVVRALNEYYKTNGLFSHREYFFGSFNSGKRMLFAGAVFYDRLRRDGYKYKISDDEEYTCSKGQWQFKQFMLFTGRLQRTGELLRTIDSLLRAQYEFKHALKKGSIPTEWDEIVQRCIENYIIRKRYENAPKIEIDLRLLNTIRDDAAVTQERLLIYNEDAEVEMSSETKNLFSQHSVLSPLQVQFLLCLLNNEPFTALLKENNTTAYLLSDEINELLFDECNDTVIVFEDDEPLILEDYETFLKGYLDL